MNLPIIDNKDNRPSALDEAKAEFDEVLEEMRKLPIIREVQVYLDQWADRLSAIIAKIEAQGAGQEPIPVAWRIGWKSTGDPASGPPEYGYEYADECPGEDWEPLYASPISPAAIRKEALELSEMDKGPWKPYCFRSQKERFIGVESDDFTHDVRLDVSGDFANNQQRNKYCEALAQTLNAALQSTPHQEDKG